MSNNYFSEDQEIEICNLYNTIGTNGDLPTAQEISDRYGCSANTITNILRRHGYKPRRNQGRQISRMFDKSTEIAICEYYWTRLPTGYYPSYAEVAESYNCSAPLIKLLLKRNGYKRRTNAETREKRPCKPINPPSGDAPLCACGCGTPVKWVSKNKHWQRYAPGHYLGEERIEVQSPDHVPWEGGARCSGWKRTSVSIKNRDKWTCQICKKQYVAGSGYLHVHHINEDKTNSHPHNLISLCAKCHQPVHGKDDIREKLRLIAIANTAHR